MKYSALEIVFKWLILWLSKEKKKFTVAGNYNYQEKEDNSVIYPLNVKTAESMG